MTKEFTEKELKELKEYTKEDSYLIQKSQEKEEVDNERGRYKKYSDNHLARKIDLHLQKQRKWWKHLIYGKGELYQSYKELGIKGQRDTEQRIKEYELKKYLKKTDEVLDIGCNCGFIDLQIASYVEHIHGVEINPYLVDIAKEATEYLQIKNVFFFKNSFKDYEFPNVQGRKYNVIFSFAVDSVANGLSDLPFKDYINKIIDYLEDDGYLFFESQAEDMMKGTFNKKYETLKEYFEVIKEKKISSTYPSNVKDRIFLILQKNER